MATFSISTFRTMLRINKHRLDDELEIQAETQDRISEATAKANSRMLELKKELEATESRVFEQVKDEDPKLTNPMAEKETRRKREYISAWQAYQVARQEYEEWNGLLQAWIARGYSLNTLAKLYGDQYFTIDSVTGMPVNRHEPPEDREQRRERTLRERMREASATVAATPTPQPRQRRSIIA